MVVIVLIKKGFNFKKVKKIFNEDDETTDEDTPENTPSTDDNSEVMPAQENSEEETSDAETESDDSTSDDEEPPFIDSAEPDEREVAENVSCNREKRENVGDSLSFYLPKTVASYTIPLHTLRK